MGPENISDNQSCSNKGIKNTCPIIISTEVSPQLEPDNQVAKAKRIWRVLPNKKFSLGICDKNEIRYDKKKKLNSDTINFSLGLLKSQFPDINGFQTCIFSFFIPTCYY